MIERTVLRARGGIVSRGSAYHVALEAQNDDYLHIDVDHAISLGTFLADLDPTYANADKPSAYSYYTYRYALNEKRCEKRNVMMKEKRLFKHTLVHC